MDPAIVPVTLLRPSLRKRRRLIGRIMLAALALPVFLAVDLSPSVPRAPPPDGAQARAARDVVQTIHARLAVGNGLATVQLTPQELASAAALGSALKNFGRFDTALGQGVLTLRGSRAVGPLWLNVTARISDSARGFPQTRLTIGDLPLGATLSRQLIGIARRVLRWRGIAVPPLDDLVRSVATTPAQVTARVNFPLQSGFANSLAGLRAQPVDAALTSAIYCRLVVEDRIAPTPDMAAVVARAFAPAPTALPIVEQNRAALVALAIYTTTPGAGRLAGNAGQRVAACGRPKVAPRLGGRDDLPKHWSLSAALAVALGDDVGTAMGEWKELSDSRPGGSGFSFVDLSADRAGLAVAQAAVDPARAATIAARLRAATDEDILPVRALALSEGLTEAEFIARYANIDSARFAAARARIDAVIAKTVGR